MGRVFTVIKFIVAFIWCFPHLILLYHHKNRSVIQADLKRWIQVMNLKHTKLSLAFLYLLGDFPEFRNLFYYRIGSSKHFLNIICPKISTLHINTTDIGEGLFIRHGFATAIGAKSIGKNCLIHQQVTIGDYGGESPVIMDNVTILPGAIVIGKITIGNNAVIGANATVYQDVPDNCTVYPPTSIRMKWKKRDQL